jgi:hypothetical protein
LAPFQTWKLISQNIRRVHILKLCKPRKAKAAIKADSPQRKRRGNGQQNMSRKRPALESLDMELVIVHFDAGSSHKDRNPV